MLFLMPQEYHFTTKKGEKEKQIKTEAIAETESRTRRSSFQDWDSREKDTFIVHND